MKKLLATILAAILCLMAFSALAEDSTMNCLISEESFVVQIDDPEGDLGWMAESRDESIVNIYDADLIEDTYVVRFDPVADGNATVAVKHYTGIACDKIFTWDLTVKDGAILEPAEGSYAASPDPAESDPALIGQWETEDGMAVMTITKNPGGSVWDVEISGAAGQSGYVFKTTIYFDCEKNAFVYDKGKYWDTPITDSEEAPELGEARVAGTTGTFTFTGDPENLILSWEDSEREGSTMEFKKSAEAAK